jgi:NAD(P)-dependent dehydrogenase (short-subunit alcohol dehydrogenase family)
LSTRWALILGASSGFGAASARAFAAAGYGILGVHLDRRGAQPGIDALVAELEATGQPVAFFNGNAADATVRAGVVGAITELVGEGTIGVFLHSLAFGTLGHFVGEDGAKGITKKQLDMTLDVMAHSLIYWTQDLVEAGLLVDGGRIFAMTSSGSHQTWALYGPVSAAKAALEAHVRQLATELAPLGITTNAILAGVTRTPALEKIPGNEGLIATALRKNPHSRLTVPDDVAVCLVDLARPGTHWMNGNIIRVDGGEDCCA